jgi:hypothetical protein
LWQSCMTQKQSISPAILILYNRGFVRSKHILGYKSFYLSTNKRLCLNGSSQDVLFKCRFTWWNASSLCW